MKRLYHGIHLAAVRTAMAPSLESQTFSTDASPAIIDSVNLQRTIGRWGLTSMRKLCLLLLTALPLFAAPPVVSNISFLYGSHSSVSVVFNLSATANDLRIRYIPVSQGSCDNGNASATVENFQFSNITATSNLQFPVTGLAAGTQYEFCPEASNDGGSTWSTTGGSNPAGADFTTDPLPTIHPALPIHPATFDASYPDTTQGTCEDSSASNYGQPGYCVKTVTVSGNTCTDLSADMTTAIANQKSYGTIIEIPAGSVCEYFGNTMYNGDSRSWYQLPADAIAYNPSNVANNTITLDNHGLSEGQGVVMVSSGEQNQGSYLPAPPAGTASGNVYFVHVVDANNFQLYQHWQQETGSETSGGTSIVLDRLAGWADSPGISVGEEVVGSGIPGGTTIVSIDDDTKTLTLSQAATATASGVTFTFGGPLQDIGPCTGSCSANGGIAHFVPWPRQIFYWIIVRTSTPDSQFAPEGTRVNPSWASKMVTIEGPLGANVRAFEPYVFSTHIRFVGIEWTWTPGTETASDPAPGYALIALDGASSDIIFDRNWFHGPGTRNARVYEMMNWQGMDNAIVNSYFDDLEYWHAAYSGPGITGDASVTYSQTPTGTVGGTSFTVPETTVHYGAANPATLPSTLSVSWTGTPDASITTPEIAVYFDMQGNLQVVAPQGLAVTASAGTVSYTTASAAANNPGAYNYCDEGDPLIPLDSAGHEAAAPLGCVRLNASGQISAISQGHVFQGVADEGCQCITAGYGPGPYDFSNNYMSATGIPLHFDNSGLYWRGDYLIQRNTFAAPMTELNDQKNPLAQAAGIPSDGYQYDQRQMLEFKGIQRAWINGNIFSGSFTDIDQGAPFITPTYSGDSYGSRNVDVTNNTFAHGGMAGTLAGTFMDSGSTGIQPLTYSHFRLYNNLAWDITGYIYATNGRVVAGQFGWGQGGLCTSCGGPIEDEIIDHNTFYDLNGDEYGFMNFSNGSPVEGVSVTNNIIPYAYGALNEDLFAINYSANLTSACVGASNRGETGTNCSIMAGVGHPDLVFKGNLIIPSWAGKVWPETNTGAQVPVSQIQSDWPDYYAQNTILPDNGVLKDFAAVGFTDGTITRSWDASGNWTGSTPNFRLLSQSLYNFGQTTDGLQEGANINALEAAQGKVTLVGSNRITGSTATINYVAPDSASCSVDYSSTDPTLINSFTRVEDAGGARVRNVTLSGLSPHTVYHYRVDCAVQQPAGQFLTN